jgi:hypothetical protein
MNDEATELITGFTVKNLVHSSRQEDDQLQVSRKEAQFQLAQFVNFFNDAPDSSAASLKHLLFPILRLACLLRSAFYATEIGGVGPSVFLTSTLSCSADWTHRVHLLLKIILQVD